MTQHTKGSSRSHTLKFLNKLVKNNFTSENCNTGIIQDYNKEEILEDYREKQNKQAEKMERFFVNNEVKLRGKKEMEKRNNYCETTLTEPNDMIKFMEEVYTTREEIRKELLNGASCFGNKFLSEEVN